jgi:hypothetical protein
VTNGAVVPFAGVVTVPREAVHIDIAEQVQKALAGVADGKVMAVVNVQTGKGMNLAIAYREKVADGIWKGSWTVGAYVGKSGWNAPVEGGATVAWSR